MFGILAWAWIGNFLEGDLPHDLASPQQWIPDVLLLVASLAMFLTTWIPRLSPPAITNIGLVYEVVVSSIIPFSQYWGAFRGLSGERLSGDLVGISSVALWMLFFTVLVPAKPARALIALVLSGFAVPITIAILIAVGDAPALPTMDFVFIFVMPYVITVVVSYISARVIYGLGRDVRRAEEMGSYRLLDRIGRGGMGEVWRARHNMLARPAAIKLIRRDAPGADGPTRKAVLSRFERKAQVTASLESPHTVKLYDFGVSEDGSFYYVMELLAGEDLESLVKRCGPFPAGRVIHILRQACHSLSEAHRRGLVHRDIKPANIVLCEHAFEHDYVKILDFGLVKRALHYGGSEAITMTAANVVAGTPAYLAPEIALGRETIDGRADLYSLGCVAFRLLTGRHIFEEEGPVAMIAAHAKTAPEPPGRFTKIPIPRELDALILACLAKDPGERPATAEALSDALASIDVATPWTAEQAAAWWRENQPGSS